MVEVTSTVLKLRVAMAFGSKPRSGPTSTLARLPVAGLMALNVSLPSSSTP
ncbi:hypothetical protein SGLAM104S_08968 [Streptomyces glaucescens]